MKFGFTAFLLLAFSVSAMLSIFAMGHMDEHSKCLAEVVQGKACTAENGTVQYVNFHLVSFKGFSTAVFVLILLLVAAAFLFEHRRHLQRFRALVSFEKLFFRFVSPLKQQITRWLSLRQLSPSEN